MHVWCRSTRYNNNGLYQNTIGLYGTKFLCLITSVFKPIDFWLHFNFETQKMCNGTRQVHFKYNRRVSHLKWQAYAFVLLVGTGAFVQLTKHKRCIMERTGDSKIIEWAQKKLDTSSWMSIIRNKVIFHSNKLDVQLKISIVVSLRCTHMSDIQNSVPVPHDKIFFFFERDSNMCHSKISWHWLLTQQNQWKERIWKGGGEWYWATDVTCIQTHRIIKW